MSKETNHVILVQDEGQLWAIGIGVNSFWEPRSTNLPLEQLREKYPDAPLFDSKQAAVDYQLDLEDKAKAAPALYAALERLIEECALSRKYIVLSEDDGFKAYCDTATALNAAESALALARGEKGDK